ncbi:hypothetical protein AC1031_004334 [Aphanomyces cochlioides]|nr:hypothetical protein AC1031_004334 [Aphanomyces cochlioides]
MGKHQQKQIKWTEDIDLALLRQVLRSAPFEADYGRILDSWKEVAEAVSDALTMNISYRSAKLRVAALVGAFKSEDKSQRENCSGSSEELRQWRRRGRQKNADEKKRTKSEALESAGAVLWLQAEERVSKRQRPGRKNQKESVSDLLAFEKKKHEDDHLFRMKKLQFEKEEQRICSAQFDNMMTNFSDLVNSLLNKS